MLKEIISTDKAPKAIGTYSQAVKVGNLIFASGQIPINPATGELVTGTFRDEAQRVIDNLSAICQAAGANLGNIVKLNVFLKDLGNFQEFNQIMSENFPEPYPARSAVEVSGLPKNVSVEAEAIIAVE